MANLMPKTCIFSGFQRFDFFFGLRIQVHAALYETGKGAPVYEADFSP